MSEKNYTLLCDFYEITMANGFFELGKKDEIVYFDAFFRKVPDGAGFAIFAGLGEIIEYIKNLKFTSDDIEFLRNKNRFSQDFLQYLETFKFTGDIFSIPEGTPIFPNEPVITVRAPAIEAQFIETFLLLNFNHQSLIATKANRIVRSAEGRPVFEFGSRRAHGRDAAVLGARAAYIGGCSGTACTMADKDFSVTATGTMAHSFIQMFDSEYEAFLAYCKVYRDNVTLLVDTFNVLSSGVPNAIKAFKECGVKNCSIRIDSGDIKYLSIKAREMLDEAGLQHCKIVASNALDEMVIRDLISKGAKVDSFGVGERLITAKSDSVFGGVYKLVAKEENGEIVPKIKVSENSGKSTTPHYKKLYRLYSKKSGIALCDAVCLFYETISDTKPITLIDPVTSEKRVFKDFFVKELQVPVFKGGKEVYSKPSIEEIKKRCEGEIKLLEKGITDLDTPDRYGVCLSESLYDIKEKLLQKVKREKGGNLIE